MVGRQTRVADLERALQQSRDERIATHQSLVAVQESLDALSCQAALTAQQHGRTLRAVDTWATSLTAMLQEARDLSTKARSLSHLLASPDEHGSTSLSGNGPADDDLGQFDSTGTIAGLPDWTTDVNQRCRWLLADLEGTCSAVNAAIAQRKSRHVELQVVTHELRQRHEITVAHMRESVQRTVQQLQADSTERWDTARCAMQEEHARLLDEANAAHFQQLQTLREEKDAATRQVRDMHFRSTLLRIFFSPGFTSGIAACVRVDDRMYLQEKERLAALDEAWRTRTAGVDAQLETCRERLRVQVCMHVGGGSGHPGRVC
jgi:hypothetical protein